MSEESVIQAIKQDIEELLNTKRIIKETSFTEKLTDTPLGKENILEEIRWLLDKAKGKARVNINHVPVRSVRPLWGPLITFFKRAVRKSTYWLYYSLFQQITDFHTMIVDLLGKLILCLGENDKKYNETLLNLLSKIDENDKKYNETLLNLLSKIDENDKKYNETLLNLLSKIDVLEKAFELERIKTKGLLEEKNAEIKAQMQSIVTGKAGVQREIIEVKHCIQDLSDNLSNFQKTIDDYHLEVAFLRAKLALTLQYKQTGKLPEENMEQPFIRQKNVSFENDAWLYNVFEQSFRGSENLIKERQRPYLSDIQNAFTACEGYVLDMGAGRGEFLELCREAGIPAKGVDTNELMVRYCQEKNLDVKKADGIDYLQTIPDESLCALTAFQVVEHLIPEQLWNLIQVALVKIKPQGLIVLETVNPESFYSFKNFYLDLTHQKPIPPDTLRFLLEAAGFRKVEVRFSSPLPKNVQLNGDDEYTRKLNEILFGSQDYAVLGWR